MTIYKYAVLAAYAFLASATAGPETTGGATVLDGVSGLRARLEIVRDREGVPHIRAKNETDAMFGLGFMHANDRLWQIEYMRRVGTGRLAEVLGPPALQADKLFRTLGVAESAAATWKQYPPRQRDLIAAYVAGLNASTERQRRQKLPLEFLLLNFEPEPWRAEDVFVIAKVLGWSVDTNWDQELVRLQLTQKLGAERTAQLMPAYTADGPIILPSESTTHARARQPSTLRGRRTRPISPTVDESVPSGLLAIHREVMARIGLGGQGLGSNNQVLSASRTTTGAPLLAADPHLPAQIPAVFYRAHVTGGRFDAIGATTPGLPGVLMGHNGRIAWGWTNANADVQDFFIERIHENAEVEYNGRREPLQIRSQIIKVKGAPEVALTVRSTRHGPLVSDLVAPGGPALALRWAALDPDDDVGIAAYFDANRAQNWQQFSDSFRRFKSHPQNLLYADVNGNIAYLLAGTIPIRGAGTGTAPVPGWTSEFEWKGYVPGNQLPQTLNPRQGFLFSSNNKIAPDTYPHTLGSSFAAPYRAMRVAELLGANSRHSIADLENIQADVAAIHARELLPVLLQGQPAVTSEQKRALDLLKEWDLRATADSAATAVFEAWYIQLAESVFADELGEPLWKTYSEHLHMVTMALASALRENSAWCDDIRTPAKETCQSIALTAFGQGLERMAQAQGTADVRSWKWGKVHRAVFFHQPFDSDPVLSATFNRVVPNGGDKHTVNVASNPRWAEYDQRHIALYRQILDLSDLAKSRWIAAPGQSGVPTHTQYDDLIGDWLRVSYHPMRFNRHDVDDTASERLVLQP